MRIPAKTSKKKACARLRPLKGIASDPGSEAYMEP